MSETAHWADESFSDKQKGRTAVTFHNVQKKDEYQSKLQERPVFKEVTHIVKILPGDQSLVYDQPVTEKDKEMYPDEWARWERTKENRIPGTPLDMWPAIGDTQKAEFKAMNIRTVEEFANLPDSVAIKIMGFNALRDKARAFIASGKDAELIGRIRAESDAKVAGLEAKMKEMEAMLERLTQPEKTTA